VLQCVAECAAVCCSLLQCVAVCCGVLQCAAVCCSVLQCVAVCCSVLQCVAVVSLYNRSVILVEATELLASCIYIWRVIYIYRLQPIADRVAQHVEIITKTINLVPGVPRFS